MHISVKQIIQLAVFSIFCLKLVEVCSINLILKFFEAAKNALTYFPFKSWIVRLGKAFQHLLFIKFELALSKYQQFIMSFYQNKRNTLQQSRKLRRENTVYKIQSGTASTQLRQSAKTEGEFEVSIVNHHEHQETKIQLQRLKRENQALRLQNQSLQSQLKWFRYFVKQNGRELGADIDAVPILTEMQKERSKLKKIVQKSYLALKDFERENAEQANQIENLIKYNNELARSLEIKGQENADLLKIIQQLRKFQHQKQISELNYRIRKMQQVFNHLLKQLEQNQRTQQLQRQELLELKRYYRGY